MKKQLSFTALLLIVLFSNNIYSQWSTDPTVNNPICTQTNSQYQPVITNGSDGSFIIAWHDNRNGAFNLDIYAQRINSTGDPLWTTDGIAINSFTEDQDGATIISDGSGGAIIAWRDARNGAFNRDIFIQRINSSGEAQWNPDGVAVCTQGSSQFPPRIASDGSGGAIITWYDARNGNDDIYAQSVNSRGVVQWTADGVAVCTQGSTQQYPTITSDGSGGAIITWQDSRSSNLDIYAQRINSSGTAQWTADGVAVCTQGSTQQYPTITSDGSSGAIITWEDNRSSNEDVYAQRINSSGTTQWTANGIAVITNSSRQRRPSIISDGSGGAILTWHDNRNTNSDIYAQKINSSGVPQWEADGVVVSTNSANQNDPTIVGDGSSGAIITWFDDRNGNFDIYAAKISPDGALPVELVSFTGQLNENSVNLVWQTATEVNNYGFEVERQYQVASIEYQESGWETIGFVLGHGTTNSPKDYSFIDSDLPNVNEVNYRLKQIDNDGTFAYSKIVTVDISTITDVNDDGIVYEFALDQNYPNPFNPTTTIKFSVASSSRVNITISNVLGQQVMELVNDIRLEGKHEVVFKANNLATGVYLYRINAVSIDGKTSFTNTRKMILMK